MDFEKLKNILIDAYRKYKHYVLYNSSLEYKRIAIGDFEFDRDKMDECFNEITRAILDKNIDYFGKLVSKISYIPVIKAIEDNGVSDRVLDNSFKDKSVKIEKLNYFISCPIQLEIVDAFWSILIAGSLHSKNDLNYAYGNKLYDYLYQDSVDSFNFVNLKTLSFYNKYFDDYSAWKRSAIDTIEKRFDDKKDSTLVSLDIKRFFYSANVNFDCLFEFLAKNNQIYSEFRFVHDLMHRVYLKYSRVLKNVVNGIDKNIVIPIGLMSSGIISNLYLKEIDSVLSNQTVSLYYGRYVDDILMVINGCDYNDFDDLLEKKLKNIICKDGNDYRLIKDKNLIIQNDKIRIFLISSKGTKSLIKKLKKESLKTSFDDLFPDADLEFKDLAENIFKDEESIKPRETTIPIVDNKKINNILYSLIFKAKNCKSENEFVLNITDKQMEVFKQIMTPKIILGMANRWSRLFLVFNAQNDKSLKMNLTKTIGEYIDLIEASNKIECKNIGGVISKLKTNLKNKVALCKSMANACRGKSLDKLALKLKNSNMIDSVSINFPLINYVKNNMSINYFNFDASAYISNTNSYELDDFKIKYSPRFIHINDFFLFNNLNQIKSQNCVVEPDEIVRLYQDKISKTFGVNELSLNTELLTRPSLDYKNIKITCPSYQERKYSDDVKIGLVNINLKNENITKKIEKKKGKEKIIYEIIDSCSYGGAASFKKLIRILNDAYKIKKLNYLVFPESYLPFEWLPIIEKFSIETGITVICGIRYLINRTSKQVFNLQSVTIPFKMKYGYKQTMTFLREKNVYAPFEKQIIKNSGYHCINAKNSLYYCFKIEGLEAFSSFICYELTDIYARSLMRKKVDIVFASEFNDDIEYFSNIVDSTSRDLYCYVAQCNTSDTGDSKLIGPYRRDFKKILLITGGENPLVHVGKINILKMHEYIKEFIKADRVNSYDKLNNNTDFKKFKKPSANSY